MRKTACIVMFFLMAVFMQPGDLLFGQSGLGFIGQAPDARNCGLSGADLTEGESVNGMNVNPALLLNIAENSLSLSHSDFMDMKNAHIGFGRRFKPGVLGIGVSYIYNTSILKTDAYGNDLGEMTVYTLVVRAGMARSFLNKGSGAGISLRYIYSVLDENKGGSVSADLGAVYDPGVLNHKLKFGLAVMNLGPGVKYDQETSSLPLSVSAGATFLALDLPLHRVGLSASGQYLVNDHFSVPVGVEYRMYGMGYARFSYLLASENIRGISLGLGFAYSRYSVDFSYVPGAGTEDMAYAVTLGYKW